MSWIGQSPAWRRRSDRGRRWLFSVSGRAASLPQGRPKPSHELSDRAHRTCFGPGGDVRRFSRMVYSGPRWLRVRWAAVALCMLYIITVHLCIGHARSVTVRMGWLVDVVGHMQVYNFAMVLCTGYYEMALLKWKTLFT